MYFSVGLFQLRVIWGELRSKQGGGETSLVGMGPVIPGPALRGVDVPSGASEPVGTGEVRVCLERLPNFGPAAVPSVASLRGWLGGLSLTTFETLFG